MVKEEMEKMDERQKKEQSGLDQIMDRRQVLRTMGKFSTIAAFVLAGPTMLIEGCGKDKSVSYNDTAGEPAPDGSTAERAIPLNLGDSAQATIRASDNMVKYYKLTPTQYYDLALITITAVSFVGGSSGLCSLLDSGLNSLTTTDFDGQDTLDFSLESGTYYIKFEALHGGGVVTFNYNLGTPSWDNYNDWSNYSDAWSNYSDAWSNSWTNYSDTWGNYSDSWYNYSDYGAWGNWIESW